MSVITKVPEPNLWNEICKEFQLRRDPDAFKDQCLPIEVDYDASKHTPVFYGDLHKRITVDGRVEEDFDAAISHPACVGYAFVKRPPESPPPVPPAVPDRIRSPRPEKPVSSGPDLATRTMIKQNGFQKHTEKRQRKTKELIGSPRVYLEHYVFPVLLPALEELLRQAKIEKCFERKRTKFNAGDFLAEFLYRNNPLHCGREEVCLVDIPFVQDWWKEHPRAPLPKSLLWTEQEASLIIQSFWRGFKVREEEAVQELRQWQREVREENRNIHETVNKFWSDKIPNDQEMEELKQSDQELQEEEEAAAVPKNTDAVRRSFTPGSISTDCNLSGLTL